MFLCIVHRRSLFQTRHPCARDRKVYHRFGRGCFTAVLAARPTALLRMPTRISRFSCVRRDARIIHAHKHNASMTSRPVLLVLAEPPRPLAFEWRGKGPDNAGTPLTGRAGIERVQQAL